MPESMHLSAVKFRNRHSHLAREMGIHYIAAGHHATERYGVQALAVWRLPDRFAFEQQFIDIPNPV